MSVRFLPESSDFCGFCGAILPVPHNAPIDVSCVVCESVWLVKGINLIILFYLTKIYSAKRNLLVCKSQKIYEATVASSDMGTVEEVENEVDHVCTRFEFISYYL